MAQVAFSLGSNVNPEPNLRLGVAELERRFGPLVLSPVYRSRAAGFDGADFLNLVALAETDTGPHAVQQEIERIHALAGRRRGGERFASRPLDIDLLLHDGLVIDEPGLKLPRADILEYSFVLGPLADVAPDYVHPVTGRTMARHWADFDRASHPLKKIDGILPR
ncbi:MAG: 2-amino-4-hydroxy-6-hydroxymethyldihydropteridine diphosphokinase [Woeseiaceae bacterium]|nr:2-amino-4-hydroxy-6-hydroxymethyldihydropteridine diphosphokinase [Woeseiaceae bacterium]